MLNNDYVLKCSELIQEVKNKNPLIHHITNYVTVNDCANISLAIGASPIMADDILEVETITAMSDALVLNIGTLNQRIVDSMLKSGIVANKKNIPVVLDPVGIGISKFRNDTVKKILEQIEISVICGNISEIKFIAGLSEGAKGVDVSESDLNKDLNNNIEIAENLANEYKSIIVITGETDIVSNGKETVYIDNGNKKMASVTGTGCMCTSLVGCFCGCSENYFLSAIAGVLCMGIAGELSYSKGNGMYHIGIIDEVSNISLETVTRRSRLYEAKD